MIPGDMSRGWKSRSAVTPVLGRGGGGEIGSLQAKAMACGQMSEMREGVEHWGNCEQLRVAELIAGLEKMGMEDGNERRGSEDVCRDLTSGAFPSRAGKCGNYFEGNGELGEGFRRRSGLFTLVFCEPHSGSVAACKGMREDWSCEVTPVTIGEISWMRTVEWAWDSLSIPTFIEVCFQIK